MPEPDFPRFKEQTIMDFDPDTHPVRITTGGKIKTWVQFALDFLDVRRFSFETLPTLNPRRKMRNAR